MSTSGEHVIGPPRAGLASRVRETWEHRRLLLIFARTSTERRYAKTWLGPVWLLLRPAMIVLPQAFVFGGILKVGEGGVPYLIGFMVAFAPWHLFSEQALLATRCLEMNRRMLRQMYVPRLIVLLAAAAPALLDFAIVLAMLAVTVLGYFIADGTFWLDLGLNTFAVPASVLLLMALAWVVGLWLAVPGAQARDVRFGLRYALSFAYFLTPVAYPLSAAPAGYRTVLELNPATCPVQLARLGFLNDGQVPVLSAISTAVVLVVLGLLGARYFFRAEAAALDHL